MQIVCVSRGTLAGGTQLAERLAEKLGYQCLSREEITEAAIRSGIPVGKLEMTVVRRRPFDERLHLAKERFKAFFTATLCERALQGSVVYHGRTGHLVLPGLPHLVRLRVIQDPEKRVALVMEKLDLERKKAQRYVEQVDEDRRRWIRTLYGIDWQDPSQYDLVVNLDHVVVENAAAALVPVVRLPEFQATPAVEQQLRDLLLAARCRLALGADQRTRDMDVTVKALRGQVTVTYLPRDQQQATLLPQVLEPVAGGAAITCTMASTNVLWIQERFDPAQAEIAQVLEVAHKWNAAVELLHLQEQETLPAQGQPAEQPAGDEQANGGILDDAAAPPPLEPGLAATRQRLVEAGRAGTVRQVVARNSGEVVAAVDRSVPYSLVVVGEVFCQKNHAARTRLTNELVGQLAEQLRVPVVQQGEIGSKYLFGPRQWVRLLVLGTLAALMFLVVFVNQRPLLEFYAQADTWRRAAAVAALVLFVPLFAYCYGTFTRLVLRLLRFE